MLKISALLPVVFTLSLFSYQEIQAGSSAVMQTNLRSSTQTISRTISNQVHRSINNYRTKTNLNMRTGPKGEVILTIPRGSQVIVLERLQSQWWQISHNEKTGWVHSGFLEAI